MSNSDEAASSQGSSVSHPETSKKKREQVTDTEVVYEEEDKNGNKRPVQFTEWQSILKYAAKGAENSLNCSWAGKLGRKIDDCISHHRDVGPISDRAGVYQWAVCLQEKADSEKRRFVFYVGRSKSMRERILAERNGQQGGNFFYEILKTAFASAEENEPIALELQVSFMYACKDKSKNKEKGKGKEKDKTKNKNKEGKVEDEDDKNKGQDNEKDKNKNKENEKAKDEAEADEKSKKKDKNKLDKDKNKAEDEAKADDKSKKKDKIKKEDKGKAEDEVGDKDKDKSKNKVDKDKNKNKGKGESQESNPTDVNHANEFKDDLEKVENSFLEKYDYASNSANNQSNFQERLKDFKKWLNCDPKKTIEKYCQFPSGNFDDNLKPLLEHPDTLETIATIVRCSKTIIGSNDEAHQRKDALLKVLQSIKSDGSQQSVPANSAQSDS